MVCYEPDKMAGEIPVFLSGSFLNKRRFNRKRRRREILFQTAQSEQTIRRLLGQRLLEEVSI